MKNNLHAHLIWISSLLMAGACQQPVTVEKEDDLLLKEGTWRGAISLNDSIDLPFTFEAESSDSSFTIIIFNGEEVIEVRNINAVGDSFKIQMPVFANYLMVKTSPEELTGFYINPDAENYRLPFHAEYGDSNRFEVSEEKCCDINRKWAVQFNPKKEEPRPAIAYFNQNENHVEGTFVTETGDYRYLEGVLSGEKLRLSAFDGGHLVYFESEIIEGQKMQGHYYSGRSGYAPWMAYRDDDFSLENPDSLTFLKEGYEEFSFSFPTLQGETVSLEDAQFEEKPVIVQIMGSWCPNCMDETRYLKQVYDEYHSKGLEIVGLTFERARNTDMAKKRVDKMIEDLEIPYPVLLATSTRQESAEEALPSLNHIMSFPTTIYLDANHNIQKIHTGFSGPGTPLYEDYVEENKALLDRMVAEGANQ